MPHIRRRDGYDPITRRPFIFRELVVGGRVVMVNNCDPRDSPITNFSSEHRLRNGGAVILFGRGVASCPVEFSSTALGFVEALVAVSR